MAERFQFGPRFHLEGLLLVAAPNWNDSVLGRSVCLVVHHGAQGSVGLVLNQTLQADTPELWEHLFDEGTAPTPTSIHFGGPNSGPVVAIHSRPDMAEFSCGESVLFAAQRENLKRLVSECEPSTFRLLVGQVNWEPCQLDEEIDAGNWLPIPASPDLVFADEAEMWARAMRQIGNHFVANITGTPHLPQSVLAN